MDSQPTHHQPHTAPPHKGSPAITTQPQMTHMLDDSSPLIQAPDKTDNASGPQPKDAGHDISGSTHQAPEPLIVDRPEGGNPLEPISGPQSIPNGLDTQHDPSEQRQATPTPPGSGPKGRSIKTKEQKEALEAAYLLKQYPEEDIRRALGNRIGLTEQQVQVWFSHKRRKDKKDQEEAQARLVIQQRHADDNTDQAPEAGKSAALPQPVSEPNGIAHAAEPAKPVSVAAPLVQPTFFPKPISVPAAEAGPARAATGVAVSAAPQQSADTQPSAPADAPLKQTAELSAQELKQEGREPIKAAAAQQPLQPGEPPLREAPIARLVKLLKAQPPPQQLTVEERIQIPELLEVAKQAMPVPFRVDGPPLIYEFDDLPQINADGAYIDEAPPQKRKRVDGEDEESARKRRGSAGAKGTARNESERMEKEKKRNEDKAERENKKKELARTKEEIRLRALQEREEKKMQAQAEKERRALERKEALVERRKEKEMMKALQAQEKQATRLRQRDAGSGPKDDLDLEWEALVAQQQADGYSSGTEEGAPQDHPAPVRPEFPPPHLNFQRWLPTELAGPLGGDLLFVWSFLHSFCCLLDVPAMTVHQLLQALVDGEKSRLLGELHMGMLRIVQADMEEAHATGAMQSGSAINFLDRAIVSCATRLEEAWAWGFDVDAWRAHLGPLTWPEVLRQLAIVWGKGPKRPKPRKEVRPKMGTDGEDVYSDETGSLRLKLPVRFGIGTVKAAAWAVLAEIGPEGLSIGEIARRIQQSGLRDLRTSKTPEASVAGALSRDVIFARTAPATYGLQAIVTHHSQLSGDGSPSLKKEAKSEEKADAERPEGNKEGSNEDGKNSEERDNEDDEENESSGDEEDEDEQALGKATGEVWVQTLLTKDYKDLDLAERGAILAALTHLTLDGPTMRNTLEARQEEASRVRKQMWEEARAEKKRKQEEAAARAKQAAEEAQKVLEALKGREGSEAPNSTVPDPATATPAPEQDEQRASTTPKRTPEAEAREVKAEAPTEVETSAPQPSANPETDREQTEARSSDRLGSEVPRSESGAAPKKDDADEEKSAAAAAKERQLARAETIRKVEEANATRSEPLGLDRRYNKYWRFADADGCTNDPLSGCLIMESHIDGDLRYLGHEGGVEVLIEALDKRGAREGPLYNSLLRYGDALAKPGSPFRMPEALGEEASEQLYEEQEAWLKGVPLVAARKAKGKHPNPQDDDLCLAQLRRDMLLVEKALPRTAFVEDWDSAAWKEGVRVHSSPAEFRDSLANLELAVQDQLLSPYFVRMPLLVRGAWLPTSQEVASALLGTNGEVQKLAEEPAEANAVGQADAETSHLCWLPQTLASVALRLHTLDANLLYSETGMAEREVLLGYNYTQRPVALPRSATQNGDKLDSASKFKSLSGQPVAPGGRALPITLPPFPAALATAQRQPFTLDWSRTKKEIADEKAGILPPPLVLKLPAMPIAEKPGKKQRRSSGVKGKSTGKGKNAKGKSKLRQSALREEFDRQSEEEEAAERAAFSTPGFSDDDSDDYQPKGRKRKAEEDEEISD